MKIKKCFKLWLVAIAMTGVTLSCSVEDDVSPTNPNFLNSSSVKLGKKLENPYSVENMKKAWGNIHLTDARTTRSDVTIQTTHLYVKFTPKSEKELDILKNDKTLILYDYPLDYELEEAGTFYRDPLTPSDQPTPQYCAVQVDYAFPQGVEYDILEELFIPDEDLNNSSGRLANDETISELVTEALRITGNLTNENSVKSNGASNARTQASSWRPAGRIRVWDESIGTTTTSRRVFSHWEYYDCGDGDLYGIESNPSVSLLIKPIEQCKRAIYKTIYDAIGGSYVPLIGAKVRARRWFTTYEGLTNSIGDFSCNGTFKRDANYSIKWERNDFDIRSGTFGQALYNGPKITGDWRLDIRSGASRMYAIVHQAAFDYYYGNRLNLKSPPENSFWKTRVKFSVWDESNEDANGRHCKDCRFLGIFSQIKIWNNGGNFQAIYGTTIHELAHASHWELRKNNWNDNNTDEIVKETWARGVQWAIGNIRYTGYTPPYFGVYTGLVQDLIDPVDASGYDRVSFYSIKQIEDVLSNTSNFINWENNLRNNYANSTESNLGPIFEFWN